MANVRNQRNQQWRAFMAGQSWDRTGLVRSERNGMENGGRGDVAERPRVLSLYGWANLGQCG